MGKNSDSLDSEGGKQKSNRSRSKSTSSSFASELPSGHPSDATTRSSTFSATDGYAGVDLRKIISGKDRGRDTSPSRNNMSSPNSPVAGGGRGGWASRKNSNQTGGADSIISSTATTARTSRIELSRTASNNSTNNSSISNIPASRIIPNHLLPERTDSRNYSPAPSSRSSSPAINTNNTQIHPDSNSPARRRTFSKLLSRLGSSSSGNKSKNNRRAEGSITDEEGREVSTPAHDLDTDRSISPLTVAALSLTNSTDAASNSRRNYEPENRSLGGIIDSSEFEYSSEDDHGGDYDDEDDEEEQDELSKPALLSHTGIRGWQSGAKNFDVVGEDQDNYYYSDEASGNTTSQPLNQRYFVEPETNNTPRAVRPTYDSNQRYSSSDFSSPQFVQGSPHSLHSPGAVSRKSFGASSVRDGSIRNGISGGVGEKKSQYHHSKDSREQYSDGEEEEDGTEMFVAPRRRVVYSAVV